MLGFSNKYALGHDIFNIKENNIVVFPNGNWVTNKVYYNAQKGQYLSLNNNEIIEIQKKFNEIKFGKVIYNDSKMENAKKYTI